jgi:sigma-B regulation protein RsbU (phosphoserine phosphatase)
VSAWFGGILPGLLSTALSAWLIHQYVEPRDPASAWRVNELVRLAFFMGVAILISSLSHSLRRAQTALRAIIHASPIPIVTLDWTGHIRGWNPAARQTFGWESQQMLGQAFPLTDGEDASLLAERVCTRGVIHGLETRMASGDHHVIDLSLSAAPLPDASGRASGILIMAEDITERKRVLEALHAAQEETRRALGRERRIAERFQAALLPDQYAAVPGYAIAHTYRPALIEADVGGDFYNIFPMDDRYLCLVIGDVGGKGLDAAVVGARMQHGISALALHEKGHPDVILDGIRQTFTAVGEPDRLATLFLAILDRETGRLDYASAGHEPALVWRARERRVEQLTSHDSALISMTTAPYHCHEAVLTPGDILVLYTDGLVDPHRPGDPDLFGVERVAATLAAHHAEGPPAILNTLYDAAAAHSAGNLRDDIALIAIHRLEDPALPGEYVFVTPPA